MPFKHLRVHPLRTGCPGQLDARRYRWVFRFTLSFSVVLHRYQNKLKAKQKRSSGVKEVKEQLLTLTHSGVITWVIQEQLGCMPTFGDKQNRQGSNLDLFKLSEPDGSHLGPKYLSYKHFSPKTSTASGALCLRSVLTSDLMSPFFAVGGCAAETSVTASLWQRSRTSSQCTSPTSLCVRGIASAAHTSEFHRHHSTLLHNKSQQNWPCC